MILHFQSLHPHLEDDWLKACSGLDDASHDDDNVDVADDLIGGDTVGCPVTLSSSLASPPVDATDHVFYAVDVCNRFSSLSLENSSVMESNVDMIPAANLHMQSSVSSLVGEAVTTTTIADSDSPDNEAAVALSSAKPVSKPALKVQTPSTNSPKVIPKKKEESSEDSDSSSLEEQVAVVKKKQVETKKAQKSPVLTKVQNKTSKVLRKPIDVESSSSEESSDEEPAKSVSKPVTKVQTPSTQSPKVVPKKKGESSDNSDNSSSEERVAVIKKKQVETKKVQKSPTVTKQQNKTSKVTSKPVDEESSLEESSDEEEPAKPVSAPVAKVQTPSTKSPKVVPQKKEEGSDDSVSSSSEEQVKLWNSQR